MENCNGPVAQPAERQSCKLKARGSNPLGAFLKSVGSSVVEQEAVVLCVGCSIHPP